MKWGELETLRKEGKVKWRDTVYIMMADDITDINPDTYVRMNRLREPYSHIKKYHYFLSEEEAVKLAFRRIWKLSRNGEISAINNRSVRRYYMYKALIKILQIGRKER